MPAEKVDISIVIPLYKGEKYRFRLLEMLDSNALYANLYENCSIEVIFVNDYPEEHILLDQTNNYYKVMIVEHKQNKGIHASRVRGIEKSNGDYVVMLDQDDLVKENWLYSQWKKISTLNADYCVCNGWLNRFKTIWSDKEYEKKIKDLNYYLSEGNPIISPGQVIIRKDALPWEWMIHIQKYNGADDYLLWIMALKKQKRFIINDEYLYYHTPERNRDSIGTKKMFLSLKEVLEILLSQRIINDKEKEQFLCRLAKYEAGLTQRISKVLQDWMKLKLRGFDTCNYLKKYGIHNVAIYGMGVIGQLLYEELLLSDISVLYGIDRNAKDFRGEFPVYRVEDDLGPVDIIIVTILNMDPDILKEIENRVDCRTIFFTDILLALEEMSSEII